MKRFEDPLEIKNQKPEDKPIDSKNSPWDFRCPQYDQRSSCFVKAGTDYGKGITQPIGREKGAKEDPPKWAETWELYEKS